MQSTRSRTARIARMLSWSVLRIEGALRRMLMPSEAETARRAGTAAEKTKEVPLIRWWSTTMREPAQKPPAEFRPLATEPRSMSIWVACTTDNLNDGTRAVDGSERTRTGTLYSSVRPRPVLPTVPKEMLSSRMRRYLYLSLSSIWDGKEAFNASISLGTSTTY